MDIENMQYFTEIVNYQTITKAAEMLNISQSALSRRVILLEEELGTNLLDRSGKTVELTPAGAVFLDYCRRSLAKYDALKKRMDTFRHKNALRIGFSPELNFRLLLDAVTAVKNAYPETEFYFAEDSMRGCVEALQKGNLDLVYTVYGEIEGFYDVQSTVILSTDLSIFVPRGHRLWNKAVIELEDLKGEKFCSFDFGAQRARASTLVDMFKDSEGKPLLDYIGEHGYYNTARELILSVCINKYLGIGAVVSADEFLLFPDKIRNIPLNYRDPSTDLVFAYRKGDEKGMTAAALMKENCR